MNDVKLRLRSLFKPMPTKVNQQAETPQISNPNKRQEDETYHHWGLRVCAIANGGNYTLVPYLHSVYNYIRNEQIENEDLRNQLKQDIECKIEHNRNNIDSLNHQVNECKQTQSDNKASIKELENEKTALKSKAYEVNKEAKLKMILGITILLPLTFYLFLFYSSTFFSAFFKEWGSDSSTSVFNSMFDPHALSIALNTSVAELCFVLSAPIIFLGLGFSLHFFSIQKSWTKYIKMASILIITFIFDAILAYMIGKHLHEMEIIIGAKPLGSFYGFHEALTDINTWAVIFCGFIVYIIWGVVFDMSMSAYNQLDLNKINSKMIDKKIQDLRIQINEKKQKEKELNDKINDCNNNISTLMSQMSDNVIIDKGAIKTEMTNFFAGWAAQMNVLGLSDEEQHLASNTFENTLTALDIK